ncbi:arylsulfatase [Sinomicrobium weinanense]|uniref:sulfatase family protein n=1 Tax=Sinomicrobium weinanense TaxID=2842200 RepID=UPI0031EF975D
MVLIYTDDLGYGDISTYGGEIPTPHIDRLAEDGLKFTNAYTTASTCTPSRYSLLTGEYAWRAKGRGVAPGDASSLIKPGTETLPGVLQKAGYKTAVVGKWHLGLGGEDGPDWNGKIAPGPLEIGFDYSFLIPATGDRVPCVFVENHHVVNLDPDDPIQVNYRKKVGNWPTGKDNPELLTTKWSHGHDMTIVNGISRIGFMTGGKAALWRDEDFADKLVEKSTAFIRENKDKPFFLYFSTHDIHVPRIAHERFQGKTDRGPRGDVIVQLDWTVGELTKTLKELGLEDNTIVIFTSDNGPVLDDGYEDQAGELVGDHHPSGILRGGKYSAFEAGTRIPMIVKWPRQIKPGSTSGTLFSQIDLIGSFAAHTGQDIAPGQAPDTQNHWDVLTGKDSAGRKGVVQEATHGVLSYVSGDYKYIPPSDGGPKITWGPDIETGFSENEQLYNIKDDPSETKNIAEEHPGITGKMREELMAVREMGR